MAVSVGDSRRRVIVGCVGAQAWRGLGEHRSDLGSLWLAEERLRVRIETVVGLAIAGFLGHQRPSCVGHGWWVLLKLLTAVGV